MRGSVKRVDIEAAKEDLRLRTLDHIRDDFYHAGLTHVFSEPVAKIAMAACHEEVFERLLSCPIQSFVEQLERLILSVSPDIEATLVAWENLKAYTATIPCNCKQHIAKFFFSNVKIALTILRFRHSAKPGAERSAWPLRSLAR